MANEFKVRIENRIATADAGAKIICGNSGYNVELMFDAEWDNYLLKTVRFEWLDTLSGQKRHIDKQYTGGLLAIPTEATQDCYELMIGAYAGNLISSTAARVPCERCCTDGSTFHGDAESPDVYADLLTELRRLGPGSIPQRAASLVRQAIEAGKMETIAIGG